MANKNTVINEPTVDIKGLIKIILGVLIVVGGVYFLTYKMDQKGKFGQKYEVTKTPQAVFTYEDLIVGTSLNRTDKEYYVIYEDFGNKNKVAINSIINGYNKEEKHKIIYKVDMTKKENEVYKSNTSNKEATSVNDLKIKTPTLVLIKEGKINKYVEGLNNIKSELK